MSQHRRETDSTVKKILNLWPILFALVSIAVTWGVIETKLKYIEKTLEDHYSLIKEIPEIKVSIKFVVSDVRRLKRIRVEEEDN